MITHPARTFHIIVLDADGTRFGLKKRGAPGVCDLNRRELAKVVGRIVLGEDSAEDILGDAYRRITGGEL